MLYFVVIFTVEKNRHPIENMKLSIFLWIVFLLFNKTKLEFTVISLIILILILVNKNYMDYYKSNNNNNKNKNEIQKVEKNIYYLANALIIVVVLGFLIYFKEKYDEYYENFSYVTFIFGKNTCKSEVSVE